MKRVVLGLAAIGLVFGMSAWVSARKWTTSDGKTTVEAELVSVADGKVQLKKEDGSVTVMPLSDLGADDQKFIAALPPKGTAAAPAKEISFTKDIQPILAKRCGDCHKGSRASGGVRLDTYADLIKRGRRGAPVVAEKPAESRIIATHTGGRPHPGRGGRGAPVVQPTAEEMATLEAWIKAGAKDDTPAKK
jgi:hypothetical protein